MNRSKIEWVLNPDNETLGWTWNPITGCLNHDEHGNCYGGEFPCYAYKLAYGRLKAKYLANHNHPCYRDAEEFERAESDPFAPRLWPGRIKEPMIKYRRWGKHNSVTHEQAPKGIFVCDMGEIFGPWVPHEWQESIFDAIKKSSQHRFYLLTKQPQNLLYWSPLPDNCWVGVTATNEKMAWYAMKYLKDIEASVRFISFEPLLGRIPNDSFWPLLGSLKKCGVDWVIIGAQTKPYKPPKMEWVQDIIEQADEAGVPVFLKNNLKPLYKEIIDSEPDHRNDYRGWVWRDLVHNNIQLRQEMPQI